MRLAPYTDADAGLTARLESDPAVMRHLGGAADAARARDVHAKRLAGVAAGDHFRTIVPNGAHAPVGVVGIWHWERDGERIAELGVMLLPGWHGDGAGWRAGRMLIDEVRPPVVHAFTAVGNEAAAIGCRRIGFVEAGECDLDYEGVPLRCRRWVLRRIGDPPG